MWAESLHIVIQMNTNCKITTHKKQFQLALDGLMKTITSGEVVENSCTECTLPITVEAFMCIFCVEHVMTLQSMLYTTDNCQLRTSTITHPENCQKTLKSVGFPKTLYQ